MYSVNIISGRPGGGKTTLVHQTLFHNAGPDFKAIYMTTLSEPALKLLRYQSRFSYFNIDRFNESIIYLDLAHLIRELGLDGTLQHILMQVRKTQPGLVCIDSFKAINDLAENNKEVRKFGFDLALKLSAWECTTFLIGEYTEEEMRTESIFAIADGVLSLTFEYQGRRRRRALEVVKMRGGDFELGPHYFEITTDGLQFFPYDNLDLAPPAVAPPESRAQLAIEGFEEFSGGGLPRATSTLVLGPSGVGKTLTGLAFAAAGAAAGENALVVSFSQTEAELQEIARGVNLLDETAPGRFEFWHQPVITCEPERFAFELVEKVASHQVQRVVLDGLEVLDETFVPELPAELFYQKLLSRLQAVGVTTLLTQSVPELFGSRKLSKEGPFQVVQNVILMQYVYASGELLKGMLILKLQGSAPSRQARELHVSNQGLRLQALVEIQWE